MRFSRAAGVPGSGLGGRARAGPPRGLHPDGQRTRGQHTARECGGRSRRRGQSARVRDSGRGGRAGDFRRPGPTGHTRTASPADPARPADLTGGSGPPGPPAAGRSRTLAVPARPRRPPGARLQGLRLRPRLAARLPAVPLQRVHPGRDRARAADRARAVGRPVGTPSHPGPAGRLGAARQGRLVRGARPARARPPGGRDRPDRVHPLGRCHGRAGQRAAQRAPGRTGTRGDAQRARIRQAAARRPADLRPVGPVRRPRPDHMVPVRGGVAEHPRRSQPAVELRRPGRGGRADGVALRGAGVQRGGRARRGPMLAQAQ